MSLHEKHLHLINLVNASADEQEHSIRERELRAWRMGVEDAGRKIDICAADMHYINQGIDRPMCIGVWLDWKPKTTEQ